MRKDEAPKRRISQLNADVVLRRLHSGNNILDIER